MDKIIHTLYHDFHNMRDILVSSYGVYSTTPKAYKTYSNSPDCLDDLIIENNKTLGLLSEDDISSLTAKPFCFFTDNDTEDVEVYNVKEVK